MTAPVVDESAAPLAGSYDVALLDLDGVVYLGAEAVPYAAEALTSASALGLRHTFVTNNAARPPGVVAAQLRSFGIPCEDADVVTSAQAAARLVSELVPEGALVLVVGGDGLREALGVLGLRVTGSAADGPAAVVQGFSPDLGWALLAEGAYALADGLPWVASNVDASVPTARGRAPGNGTFVQALARVSGRSPVVAGKPERPLFDEAVARTGARRPLVVGDRLDTDIEGANRAGLDSLLVLTGVTSAVEAALAPAAQRPTHLGLDLRALLDPPRRARREGEVWRCGSWAALVEDRRVLVVPVPESGTDSGGEGTTSRATDAASAASAANGDSLDAVRAAAAAAAAYEGELSGVEGLPPGLGAGHGR